MSELSPLSSARETPARLRMRCVECDVAWSGLPDSTCWVCDGPGTGLRTIVRFRDTDHFDLELDFD